MENCTAIQKHGEPPCAAAVIHGGPGAGSEVAAVVAERSSHMGLLKPIQSAGGAYRPLLAVIRKSHSWFMDELKRFRKNRSFRKK